MQRALERLLLIFFLFGIITFFVYYEPEEFGDSGNYYRFYGNGEDGSEWIITGEGEWEDDSPDYPIIEEPKLWRI